MCKNNLHVCTYSTVRFALRFVNLFVEVSPVCAAASFYSLAALGGTMDPPDFEDTEKRADAKIDILPMYSIAF